jgi:hypothetical protein
MEQFFKRTRRREVATCTTSGIALALAIVCALSHRALAQDVSIAGTIRYYSNNAAVPDAVVQLGGAGLTSTSTDAAGAYVLTDSGQGDCQVEPTKTGDQNGAVSALDASWVMQAVVGLRELSANQILACDVTGDGTVSALDAARILQFVAGLRNSLPAADTCGSNWLFAPAAASIPGQELVQPQMAPMCSSGAISFVGLASPVNAQDFVAILLGDCTGNWQPAPPPTATASNTPLASATPTHTASVTATPTSAGTATRTTTPTASATWTRTPVATATPTRTGTATSSATLVPTGTSTRTPFPTGTATGTTTSTPSVTRTPSQTSTRTPLPTWTPSSTVTQTRTNTVTPTATASWTGTATRTGTRTTTPTATFTVTSTPTATCAGGLAWNVSAPLLISSQSGGDLWLAKTVPTDFGWGIFWLRDDPAASQIARLYYAHVDFSGQITVGPVAVIDIPKIAFRGHYDFVAWNQDHYGLTISNQATLYYYNLSLDGVVSGRKVVPVSLFLSDIYDQESDGEIIAFPGGLPRCRRCLVRRPLMQLRLQALRERQLDDLADQPGRLRLHPPILSARGVRRIRIRAPQRQGHRHHQRRRDEQVSLVEQCALVEREGRSCEAISVG